MSTINTEWLKKSIALIVVHGWILLSTLPSLAQTEESASLYVFVSDLHLGVGRDPNASSSPKPWHQFEDFRWHDALNRFLGYIDEQGESNTTLIMLGDVFELWQSHDVKCVANGAFVQCVVNDCNDANLSRPPHFGCTETEVLVRLENIIVNHKKVFDDLVNFLSKGNNRLVIVPGNHDAGILYPSAIKRLTELFGSPRIEIAEKGYWFHEKLKLLAEHGHQMDLANKFDNWPIPYARQNDKVVYLQRPSGEQLVQHFYNSYEAQYPVLDNATSEIEAAKIVIQETGARGFFHGVSEFFKMLFLRMSFPQAFAMLGEDNKTTPTIEWRTSDWPADWARHWTDPRFVVEALDANDDARQVAERAIKEGKLDIKPASLTNEQLIGLCELRQKRVDEKKLNQSCPRKDPPVAGEIARRIFDIDPLPDYLLSRKTKFDSERSGTSDPFLQPINLDGDVFNVFIYGHTHLAQKAELRSIGGWNLTTANTGAFHRVVNPSRLKELIRLKKDKTLAQVTVEDLPDCYSFITVDAKLDKTQPELHYWVGDPNGSFRAEKGDKGCPDQ